MEQQLRAVLESLTAQHGSQVGWWPQADGAIEVCVGAILVQHTTWASAARAIEALRAAGALDCRALLALPEGKLEELVRTAGTYRGKARTLRAFATAVVEEHGGSVDALLTGGTDVVRTRLLRIRGIGPETADAITLYAAGLPTFVVDAYTLRLLERVGIEVGGALRAAGRIDAVRAAFITAAGGDVTRLQQWHALIVEHVRSTCRARAPRCGECALRTRCVRGAAASGADGAPLVAPRRQQEQHAAEEPPRVPQRKVPAGR